MKLAPSLRFPGFDSEWIESSLGDTITSLDAGVSVNSEDIPASGDELGILKTSCVTKGYFDPAENKRVLDPAEINRLKEPVSKDSIVISRMNTPALVGLSGLVPQNENRLFLPDRLWAAKISSNHAPRWVAQLLASEKVRGQLSDRASGTSGSMKNITKGDVLSLPVFVPSFPEQRKIADFLTAVDGRIAQLSQKKALLESYKKGVMQQLFSQALRFQDDHGNDFPEWEEMTLGEAAEVLSGFSFKSGDFSQGESNKVIRMSDLKSGQIARDDHATVADEIVNGLERFLLRDGDFLFGMSGSLSNYAWVTGADLPAYLNQRVGCLRKRGDNIPRFLHYLFLSREVQNAIESNAVGAAQLNISSVFLRELEVLIPSRPEQTKIANFLTALDSKIEAVAEQIAHTQTWKKGLLQQMFV